MNRDASNASMSRRRFISIAAAAGGLAALPAWAATRRVETYSWSGIALGAEASLTLQHDDEAEAKSAIAACLAEVQRLEAMFSLYREDSALVRLNASGRLEEAPLDLRILLAEALRLSERTGGAFDPTVQPLWSVYAAHFSAPQASPSGPANHLIDEALARTDWRAVELSGAGIRLTKPEMAITLNGIAQGYITDKISDLLASRGFEHVLVNMGEQRALGAKWDGEAWRIGVADPQSRGGMLIEIPVSSGAVATSGGYGCRFDAAGRFTHILDPRTGASARQFESITVIAPRATEADGLSTALSVLGEDQAKNLCSGTVKAFAVPVGGSSGRWL